MQLESAPVTMVICATESRSWIGIERDQVDAVMADLTRLFPLMVTLAYVQIYRVHNSCPRIQKDQSVLVPKRKLDVPSRSNSPAPTLVSNPSSNGKSAVI